MCSGCGCSWCSVILHTASNVYMGIIVHVDFVLLMGISIENYFLGVFGANTLFCYNNVVFFFFFVRIEISS